MTATSHTEQCHPVAHFHQPAAKACPKCLPESESIIYQPFWPLPNARSNQLCTMACILQKFVALRRCISAVVTAWVMPGAEQERVCNLWQCAVMHDCWPYAPFVDYRVWVHRADWAGCLW